MKVDRRTDDLASAVAYVRRVRGLQPAAYQRLLAAVGERLATIYAPLLPSELGRLMMDSVDVLWEWDANTSSTRHVEEIIHRWEAPTNDRGYAPSAAVGNCLNFFEYALRGLLDSEIRPAAAEYITASVDLLPAAMDEGKLAPVDLTIHEPYPSVGPRESHPPSTWLEGERAFQSCVLQLAEKAGSTGRILDRLVVHETCWGDGPRPFDYGRRSRNG